ncbi:MAG: discoidin domain-containing protein, partial [Lachnospiraceae bacterium]|nr:discoidin domain-containing protein [Lachnospiraceae bacterium]
MKGIKNLGRKALSAILAAAMVAGMVPQLPAAEVQAAESGALTAVESATAANNIVTVNFNDGIQGKITFLEGDIFRYNVDPSGEFSEYATVMYPQLNTTVKIPQYPDSSDEYSHPGATVSEADGYIVITAGDTTIKFEKATAKMTVAYKDNVVMEESDALVLGSQTTQSLVKHDGENFFGGGTQNGRFIHTGETINIANESNWVDGGVASPNPFYYTSEGYGVLRNTFLNGKYHFGSTKDGVVEAVHNENEFDAYYFLSDGESSTEVVQDILNGYYHVTGNPVLLPEYGFYEGHLNAYNRDSWTDTNGTSGWKIYGSNSHDGSEGVLTAYKEAGQSTGYRLPENAQAESLNGEGPTIISDSYHDSITTPYKFSARAVIDQYVNMDMPLGYFLPNDGYGAGYGQNGYYMTGDVNSEECIEVVDANVKNLADFTAYARENGVETGLWTQSYLTPQENPNEYWHLLRDFKKEVEVGGVTTLKTDVAWVGWGYNMALNAQMTGYNTVSTGVNYRPNVISLDGWAGTQRFAGIWTGDQYGGNWEYIRFHVPTYIGQSLSGNPNIGSDMDGIFSGSALISTRDTQWKIFTPTMLNMDGWGSYAKTPQTFGDPYTGINRMYLKLKAQLMPYIYTNAAAAANIDTGNNDTGLPMIRAMFLEYPNDEYAATKNMQYQYMFGENVLVAPVYTETDAIDAMGNDVRNGIYLPDEDQVWIDYWTGDQYYGGQVLNNFDAPIWKTPFFVKNGAIIPMWEENNNPADIDKANRIAEFWPAGSTEYTLYEDDGTYVENTQTDVDGYGKVNDIDYGEHVSTKYTSVVTDGTAVLTAEKSTGTYEGYDKNKNTTFIVNVSAEPTKVTAANGSTALTMVKADSKDAVLNAEVAEGTFVYYYDAAPAIETYAVEGEDEFAAMMADEVSSPKLYVKFAETDSQANAQVLTLEGFENVDADLPVNELDETLGVPANLADVAESKTPTSNTIAWEAVEGATSYEVRVDGVVNNVGNVTTYVHTDQAYNSTHTYAVRARGENGYSAWSEEIEATTALDPWRNVPAANITWNGGDAWGALDFATDHDTATMFHSTGDVVSAAEPFIFDFGAAYDLDKFEYYPRDNYGNGTVSQMDIYTSLDGVHWNLAHDGASDTWTYDKAATVVDNVKTVDLTGNAARYVKLIVKNSAGGFFSANELAIYKKDGSSAFAVGSTGMLP